MRKGGAGKNAAAEKERQEKEAEARRQAEHEELRRKVIEEQISRDPIRAYVEELKVETETIADPLEYSLIWGSPEEWSNIPQLVAKYCIHTQAHLNALVQYLKSKSKDETSANLRAFAEKQFEIVDERFVAYKRESTGRIHELFGCNDENRAYEKLIDGDFIKFKNYCDAFKNDTVAELFGLKEEDMHYLQNDNVGQANQAWAMDELQFGEKSSSELEAWLKGSRQLAE